MPRSPPTWARCCGRRAISCARRRSGSRSSRPRPPTKCCSKRCGAIRSDAFVGRGLGAMSGKRQLRHIVGVALPFPAFILSLLITACTTAPLVRDDGATLDATDRSFQISGRLSAKRGTAGATANFDWDHAGNRDRIDLASPFGQVYARIDGTPERIVVERPGGATEAYPDWNAMTVALLGAPVPMNDLAFWVR